MIEQNADDSKSLPGQTNSTLGGVTEKKVIVRGVVKDVLENADAACSFADRLREVAMLYSNGDLLDNEAVVELSLLLGEKPMTKSLLQYIGVKKFTLSHSDFERLSYIDVIGAANKVWMRIDKGGLPEEIGLPFDVDLEIGDELRGTLVLDTQQRFCILLPNDTKLYPLDTAALASLESRGGASACLNTKIIVHIEVGDGMRMTVL